MEVSSVYNLINSVRCNSQKYFDCMFYIVRNYNHPHMFQ